MDGRRHGGDRAAVHRHQAVSQLVTCRRASRTVRVRDDRVVDRNLERACASARAIGRCEPLAAIGVRLREVPGRERVIGVVAGSALALPGQVLDGDLPAGGRPAARHVEPEPLRGYLIFGVLGVVRVQDSVDPALRNAICRVRCRTWFVIRALLVVVHVRVRR